MHTRSTATLSMAFFGWAVSQPCVAAEADDWQYEVTPYFLASGMEGTVGARGNTADIDVPFSDIWDSLDAGFMGLFTAQKGPWSYGLEAVYMKLEGGVSNTVTGPRGVVSVNGRLDVENSMYIAQGTVGYRVLDDKTKLDLTGALRYTKLDLDMNVAVQFTPGVVFPGGTLSAGGSENWTDAVVGVRVLHPLSERVSLLGYADVGAGGSDITYQATAGVNWEFKRDFTAKVGYRYMYWDYANDGVVWDIAASGPYLGLGIRF